MSVRVRARGALVVVCRGRRFELKKDARLAEPRNVPHRVVHIDRKEAGESESESE